MNMAQHPLFKSEVFVPIRKDSHSFEERQRNIWEDMHERMERRRREWEDEVNRMRSDFFSLKPAEARRGSSENLLEKMDLNDMFYDDVKGGNKVFRVSFDVSQFEPHEITVRTQDQRLIVNAKHEDKGGGKNISREYSRQVDIPKDIDPQKLRCTLSRDGILQLEADVSAPAYDLIRDSSRLYANTAASSPLLQSGPVMTEQDGSKKFQISVDIGKEFDPQDLSVKTVDRKLVVQARHEEKLPGKSSCKEFSREFDLPENVDPNLVTASMTAEGKLILEAPMSSYSQGSYTGKPGSSKRPEITLSFGKS